MPESMTTTVAEPSATDVYALGRDPGESAWLQRQSEELRTDSTALLDRVGIGPDQSAIDLQVVTVRDGTTAFAATLVGTGRPCHPKSGISNPGIVHSALAFQEPVMRTGMSKHRAPPPRT